MIDLLYVLFAFTALAIPLYLFYKISDLKELIKEWIKDRERVRQLRWESKQVQGILDNMSEEGVLQKMTTVERVELHEMFAKEYPVWYSIYGKEMPYIPRN
jgi:hypothetical protein